MNAIRLFALLVYTFGVFAYGAMLALWIGEMGRVGWAARTRGITPGREVDAINGALLALSFLWFVSNVSALLAGMTPHGRVWLMDAATIVLAFAFPPLIMHVSWTEVARGGQALARAWRLALWPAYLACLAVPLWALVLLAKTSNRQWLAFANHLLTAGLAVAFIGAAMYSIALVSRNKAVASVRDRQSRRSILALFGCMIVVFILLFVASTFSGDTRPRSLGWGDLVEVVAKSLPLVFMFVSTYYENRFAFFDLFVKRGAGFVISMAVLTIWLAVMLPILRPLVSTWAAPWLFAVALIPAVVVIPWLYVIVSDALDRRWLGRPCGRGAADA